MQVVRGKRLADLPAAMLADLRRHAARVIADIGAGDARAAYRLAKAHPDWLVIGIDPAWQRMTPTSVRSGRKPAKGGTGNLLLVNASIETVPAELHNVADEVLVLMPWGKLLRGIVNGEHDVCAGLRAVARPGATLQITVGTSIWRDPVPREVRGLPELTPGYVDAVLAERLATAGWQVTASELMTGADARRFRSSWGQRLGSSAQETVMHIQAVAVIPAPGAP